MLLIIKYLFPNSLDIPSSGRSEAAGLTATLRTDAVSAQMTARLFCEGSVRDKQIAQESSDHKYGRTEPETVPLHNGSVSTA